MSRSTRKPLDRKNSKHDKCEHYNYLRDQEGRIVKWHGTVVDMHDWKQSQEDLRQTQANLAHVARVATLNAYRRFGFTPPPGAGGQSTLAL